MASLLRRNEELDPVAEEQQADLVVVVDGAEGQDRRHLGRHLALALLHAPEIPGGTDIKHDHHRHLPLLGELLDIGLPGAGGDVPVDGADLVARRVGADLLEVHPASLEDALVLSRERRLDKAARAQLEAADLAENLAGIVHRCFGARSPGAGIPNPGLKLREPGAPRRRA